MKTPSSRKRVASPKKATPKKATAKKAAKRTPRKTTEKARVSPVRVETATTPSWRYCVDAIAEKKGTNIRVLDLRPVTSFADFFVIASGSNQRQVQAIADAVSRAMNEAGDPANSVEGYDNAEWVLLDFGDMVVHVFSDKAREYYELDRLWRDAPEIAATPSRQ
ncbi:MAG: ribosome silencing factor [Bryobacteraceae bacterium]